MGSQGAQLESSLPSYKGQAARIVLTEPTSFDTRTPSNSAEPICSAKRCECSPLAIRITCTQACRYLLKQGSDGRAESSILALQCRLLQFSDSSDDSRSTSLNENVGAAAKVVELQGLNTLLFGAIQALCQQPGTCPSLVC